MTALGMAICSLLIVFIFIMIKLGKFKAECVDVRFIYIPAIANIIGLFISAIAPGNALRASESETMGAVKSVLVSVFYVFDLCINDMTRWEVILVLLIIALISWKMGEKNEKELKHPVLFGLFTFLLTASSMTPPLYAVGNVDAGRVHSLIWMEYIILLIISVSYYTVWVRHAIGKHFEVSNNGIFSSNETLMLIVLSCYLFIGSILCVYENPQYYTATSATFDLAKGNGKKYLFECEERLKVLKDDAVKDAALEELTVRPELLFYQDLSEDAGDWINQNVAIYYDKDSVYIK